MPWQYFWRMQECTRYNFLKINYCVILSVAKNLNITGGIDYEEYKRNI